MRLDEFLRLAGYLNQLQDKFPGDTIWGELEQSVRGHLQKASENRTYLVNLPSARKDWEEWCREDHRRLISGESVEGTIYYPKPVILDDSSLVDGGVYSTAEIKAGARTIIRGDLVSRKSITWRGKTVRSLVAPEIHVDQSVHNLDVSGSILCRKLKATPRGRLGGKIAGSVFVSEAIADAPGSQANNWLEIAGGSKIGGINVPCGILGGEGVTIRHIQAEGDVRLGPGSHAEVVKGRHVEIGSGSEVKQIYSQWGIDFAEDCHFRDAIAYADIRIGSGCEVLGGIIASLEGEIIAEDPNWWEAHQSYHYKGDLSALLEPKKAAGSKSNAHSIILRMLPHAWYWSLKKLDPDWLNELTPVENGGVK